MDLIIIDHWQSRSPTCTWCQLRTYHCNIIIEPTGVKRISMELLWALSATKYIFQRFVGFQAGVGAPEEEPSKLLNGNFTAAPSPPQAM